MRSEVFQCRFRFTCAMDILFLPNHMRGIAKMGNRERMFHTIKFALWCLARRRFDNFTVQASAYLKHGSHVTTTLSFAMLLDANVFLNGSKMSNCAP